MNSAPVDSDPSAWETPEPVLLNPWKHHAGFLRTRSAVAGPAALEALARNLVVIGSDLMDLYTGPLTPHEIGAGVIAALEAEGRLSLPEFQEWLAAGGGYQVLTLAEDASRWVLRRGEASGRYVHVHPGRGAPQTCRVRANVLKTAVLALADARLRGGDPNDRGRINELRRKYLGLSPVGQELVAGQGIGSIIALLKGN